MTADYQQLLDQLAAGEIAEIKIEPKDFFAFRQVWQNHPQRKEIVGIAQRNGNVLYRFHENASL
ncbi:hypothetical protein FC83_GL000771 [Agrilactobacillus composti DSM 18527 = JCM 14202]|uniref:Uncharacterized protein n=1 Tax=Agrilactobacillus composti DSM 18527 = JCM 14202 TaxID=1423734 RepID=X0PRH2_9LACO|nr:hypothetical protein [Agrilactobacillus composti]KRM31475.1 hypothetical protein FC83_GL000771 [Agrilactobacillus composti DSM 18527 = JCM 14202]GAF40437.1 hypothetical protein JCM14202_2334 [Agrilactobacillus composti DSM 18527 = JCM 14202]